jgi:hypothetical protein
MFIEEIWGFGSFFRLKGSPKDIDLGLKLGENGRAHRLWLGFHDLMEKADSEAEGKRDKYPTPGDALHALLLKGPEGEQLWKTFSSWVAEVTWATSDREWYKESPYSQYQVTNRVLTRGLPKISISQDIVAVNEEFPFVTDALTLVWSRTKPHVRANLAEALAPENLRKNLIVELEGFDRQLSAIKLETSIRRGLFECYLRTSREGVPADDGLVAKAKELFPKEDPQRVEQAIKDHKGFFASEVRSEKTIANRYRDMITEDLQTIAEKKRVELKEALWEAVVTRDVLESLAFRKGKAAHASEKRDTAEEMVTMDALNRSDKTPASQKRTREALKKLGLPQHNVIYDKAMRYYLLVGDSQDLKEITNGNRQQEVQRLFSKAARNEAKKFSRHLSALVGVNEDLKPYTIYLNYQLRSRDRGEKSKEEAERLKDAGFSVFENEHETSAHLYLSVAGADTPEAVAKRIREVLSVKKA